MSARQIIIPYSPRVWAQKLHNSWKRWAVLILHRRAGKTTAILNHHQRAALDDEWEEQRLRYMLPKITGSQMRELLKHRVYWAAMPTFNQAKISGAWSILKSISAEVESRKPNEAEMSITYGNGNKIQLVGAEKPDRKRGPGLSGASLDEYSQIPEAFYGQVISKALGDHQGYCIWSGTIKGFDQLYKNYQTAKNNPEYFALWQNIDISLAEENGGTIAALRQSLEDDRKQVLLGIMSQEDFDQEWYLSPEAAIRGTFYGDHMKALRDRGHICRVPYDPSLLVETDWDLGLDAMAVWFSQTTRSGEIRFIDYYEDIGGGMAAAIKALKGQRENVTNDERIKIEDRRRAGYTYGSHWGPHDIMTREMTSPNTRWQFAKDLGVTFSVTDKLSVQEGISAVQAMLPLCWYDEENCKHGIRAMQNYKKTYNPRLDQFTEVPVHDWSSHSADAKRGHAVRRRTPKADRGPARPRQPSGNRPGGWMSR